jgi:hypothetical protein
MMTYVMISLALPMVPTICTMHDSNCLFHLTNGTLCAHQIHWVGLALVACHLLQLWSFCLQDVFAPFRFFCVAIILATDEANYHRKDLPIYIN